MDTFSITLTEKAFSDLKEIFQYIRNSLKEPEIAKQQQERIKQDCFSLANFPNRYAFVPDSYLREQGVRFFSVDNYLVFYVVNAQKHTVSILRILYSRRDWQTLLSNSSHL